MLLNYDKNNFEIYLYFNHEKDDEVTDDFKKIAFKSKNISDLKVPIGSILKYEFTVERPYIGRKYLKPDDPKVKEPEFPNFKLFK